MTTQISSALFERGTLVDLYIGRWSGNKKLRPTDVMLEEVNQDAIRLGHKKLMPKKAMDALQSIERRARQTLDVRSVPFPIAGAKFVFFRSMEALLKDLGDLKKEWDSAVSELLKGYPQFKEEQLKVLDAEANKLFEKKLTEVQKLLNDASREKAIAAVNAWRMDQQRQNRLLYPLVDDLQKRFPFEWRIFDIAPPRQLGAIDQQDLVQAQKQIQNDLQGWVKETTAEIHKALGEAAGRAKDALEANGQLTPRNLRPLFEAFESFRTIDFSQGSSSLKTIEDLKKQFASAMPDGEIDFELTAHNMSDAKDQVKALLTSMSQLAVDETAQSAAREALLASGSFGRLVDL